MIEGIRSGLVTILVLQSNYAVLSYSFVQASACSSSKYRFRGYDKTIDKWLIVFYIGEKREKNNFQFTAGTCHLLLSGLSDGEVCLQIPFE